MEKRLGLIGIAVLTLATSVSSDIGEPTASALAPPDTMSIATGTFEVHLTPQREDTAGSTTIGRLSIRKTFSGGLAGTSHGEMLTAVTPVSGSAGYVAIERFEGMLDGLKGSFVLQHFGVMDRGEQRLTLIIVPDSGADELAGISGTMSIEIEDGAHTYELSYRLDGGG